MVESAKKIVENMSVKTFVSNRPAVCWLEPSKCTLWVVRVCVAIRKGMLGQSDLEADARTERPVHTLRASALKRDAAKRGKRLCAKGSA